MSYTSGNVNYAYTVPSLGSTGVATVASSPSAAGSVTILDSFTVDSIFYSVTSIDADAFSNCYDLTSITIGNSVTSIGDFAFSTCSALASITIPDSVTSMGNSVLHYCNALASVTIGSSVPRLGDSTFYNCFALTSITIPNSVTSLGTNVFQFCSALTSVTIGNSVTSIGYATFYSCSALTSVTIGNSVTSIGESAFGECSALASVTFLGSTIPSIGSTNFNISGDTAYYYFGTANTSTLTMFTNKVEGPIVAPAAPTNLVATISPTNSNTALIAFEQTEKDTITSYTYASSIDGGATYSDFSSINLTLISATQISISGLTITNGTTYYFKLKSCNGVNSYSIESTPSNSIFVNFAQPAPKIQLVSAVNKVLSISFTQAYATAYDIISYECSINGGLTYITINQTTSPFLVQLSSSTNATYSVILKANNGLLSVASNTFTLRKINRIGNIV